MSKSPSWVVALESNFDSLIHTEMDSEEEEEDVIADRELLEEVWAKGNSVQVTKSFNKGIDSEVGTAKAGVPVELEDTDSNSEGWQKRSTRDESLAG